MWAHFYDWMTMLVRWLHITAAMMWIGTSFFFMWLDRSVVAQKNAKRQGHIGELWMVHGGGFYQVEKMLLGPNEVPEVLHWFKWEAGFTWLSGLFLLLLVFYSGDGIYLLDKNSSLSVNQAYAVGILSIIGGWIVYDLLWQSPLAKKSLVCHFLTVGLAVGIAYLLCKTLNGRAAYIHMGGVLGTWMIGNVWNRILPNQTKMIAATKAGTPVDPNWAINAKNRSTHNNYITLAVIFIMMSNHFPETYGHQYNWVFLVLIGLVGAFIRLFFNKLETIGPTAYAFLVPAFLGLIVLFFLTMPASQTDVIKTNHTVHQTDPNNATNLKQETLYTSLKKMDSATVGVIQGKVLFEGTPPALKILPKESFPGSCHHQHTGDVSDETILIQNGRLQNVFIQVRKGLEGWELPPPGKAVVLDQKGCVFAPHVLGVQTRQKVIFRNSDNELHNVNGFFQQQQIFNLALPLQNQEVKRSFEEPLFPIELQCDVHPWMRAYIGVVAHPYFAVTNASGEFQLGNLPPGEYVIEAWHEYYGSQTQTLTLTLQGKAEITFTFKSQ